MNWHRPCNCLGNLTDALHISPQTADNIMKLLLAYLLIGSYGLMFWRWKQGREANMRIENGGVTKPDKLQLNDCAWLFGITESFHSPLVHGKELNHEIHENREAGECHFLFVYFACFAVRLVYF
jgi:hypothetical protein